MVVLCHYNDVETDCDVDSYSIGEFRLHVRVAGCTDMKLKDELMKLDQSDSDKPLTLDSIFQVTRDRTMSNG